VLINLPLSEEGREANAITAVDLGMPDVPAQQEIAPVILAGKRDIGQKSAIHVKNHLKRLSVKIQTQTQCLLPSLLLPKVVSQRLQCL